jgi:nucleotide-binding universal stress UspA family protein
MNANGNTGQFQNILIGYDGSKGSQRALQVGLAIARGMHARVELLAVASLPEPAMLVGSHAILDGARKRYTNELEQIAKAARETGIEIETEIQAGQPAAQLIKQAEENNIDLIVLGRRGTSRLSQLIMGSVSERVLRYASCPVLVTSEVPDEHSLS